MFQDSSTIVNKKTGLCLDAASEKSGGLLKVNDCDGSDTQKWTFEHYL